MLAFINAVLFAEFSTFPSFGGGTGATVVLASGLSVGGGGGAGVAGGGGGGAGVAPGGGGGVAGFGGFVFGFVCFGLVTTGLGLVLGAFVGAGFG